jgi:hypothetical protein
LIDDCLWQEGAAIDWAQETGVQSCCINVEGYLLMKVRLCILGGTILRLFFVVCISLQENVSFALKMIDGFVQFRDAGNDVRDCVLVRGGRTNATRTHKEQTREQTRTGTTSKRKQRTLKAQI